MSKSIENFKMPNLEDDDAEVQVEDAAKEAAKITTEELSKKILTDELYAKYIETESARAEAARTKAESEKKEREEDEMIEKLLAEAKGARQEDPAPDSSLKRQPKPKEQTMIYRLLAKTFHPDLRTYNPAQKAKRDDLMKEINHANDVNDLETLRSLKKIAFGE